MADFVAVLRKTIDGLADNTPALRAKVYDKARATVAAKLAAINPPPPAAVADRQKQVLEDAIRQVEAGYSGQAGDPFDELEYVFAGSPKVEPAPAKLSPSWSPEVPAPVAPRRPVAPPQPMPALSGNERGASREAESVPAADDEPFTGGPAGSFDGDDYAPEDTRYEEPVRRRNFLPLLVAVVALVAVLGGAYAVWLNRTDFMAMLGIGGGQAVASAPAVSEPAPANPPPPATAMKSSVNDSPAEETQKFTQRLKSDGTEVDPGPAGGIKSIGEGTTVAAATLKPQPAPAAQAPAPTAQTPAPTPTPPVQPGAADSATPDGAPTGGNAAAAVAAEAAGATPPAPADAAIPPAPAATPPAPAATPPATAATPLAPATTAPAATAPAETPPAPTAGAAGPNVATTPPAAATDAAPAPADGEVPVGQKAIFYEERTNVAEGSAEPGNVVWTLVQESPGDGRPPEPAIHGEATIPGKDLQLRVTIRRNADKTLPASHIIELIFLTPADFDGGGIDKVLRFTLKDTEEDAGNAVLSITPTKVGDGYFLVALNDTKAEIETNLTLLKREKWIDVPVVYSNGRRALITMEKGIPGDKVFDEVIKAWQGPTASAG
jgi:hypothetical protein